MFAQRRLNAWSAGIRNTLALPLRVELWNGQRLDFSSEAPRVTIRVPNPGALRYLLSPSLYNLGSAYVEGAIEVRGRARDMIAVVGALANHQVPRNAWTRTLGAFGKGGHTRASDAAAVSYHYDVSNDFYQAWLDPALVYSCAYFENGDESLATAQQKKIDHILSKIQLQPGQHQHRPRRQLAAPGADELHPGRQHCQGALLVHLELGHRVVRQVDKIVEPFSDPLVLGFCVLRDVRERVVLAVFEKHSHGAVDRIGDLLRQDQVLMHDMGLSATDAVPAYIFADAVAGGSRIEPGAAHWRFDVVLRG